MPNLSLKDRTRIYPEMRRMIHAGFGIDRAARMMQEHARTASSKALARSIQDGVKSGHTLAGAMEHSGVKISGPDLAVIDAAEQGGVLEDAFAYLSRYYDSLLKVRNRIQSQFIYPLVLVHLAVILPLLPALFSGGKTIPEVVTSVLLSLGVIYLALGGTWVAVSWITSLAVHSPVADTLLRRIPLFGSFRAAMAMERFCSVLRIHLVCGRRFSEAMESAGKASGSALLSKASTRLQQEARSGNLLGPTMRRDRAFPEEFASSYETAEQTGSLDEELLRWTGWYQELVDNRLDRLAFWIPKIFYFLVVGWVAWRIVGMYQDYWSSITDFMDGTF